MASIQELEKDFKRLVKNDTLGHAYLLHGPDVPGQFAFAKALANFLETKEWSNPTNRPLLDAKFVDGTAQDLGVDVAREFSEFLYRQPVASPRRTLIVGSAAELTTQAQNALLKIVEEPPAHALIVLTVRDSNSLLPPLRSRLQAFYVAAPGALGGPATPVEERARELVEQFLLANAAGRSTLIKQMVEADKEDDVEKSSKIVDTFVSYLIAELAKKPEAHARVLTEALKRQAAMADYSTSKKLQLEALAQYL